MTDVKRLNDKMIIIYTRNKYGISLEVVISFCCDEMKANYDIDHDQNGSIYFDLKIAGLRKYHQSSPYPIPFCPYCNGYIHTELRPIENFTDFDPPCMYSGCSRPSTESTAVTVRGFKIQVFNCDFHTGQALHLTERLHSF